MCVIVCTCVYVQKFQRFTVTGRCSLISTVAGLPQSPQSVTHSLKLIGFHAVSTSGARVPLTGYGDVQ